MSINLPHIPAPYMPPEILDMILLSMPRLQLLGICRRVCRHWQQHIDSSPLLQRYIYGPQNFGSSSCSPPDPQHFHLRPVALDLAGHLWHKLCLRVFSLENPSRENAWPQIQKTYETYRDLAINLGFFQETQNQYADIKSHTFKRWVRGHTPAILFFRERKEDLETSTILQLMKEICFQAYFDVLVDAKRIADEDAFKRDLTAGLAEREGTQLSDTTASFEKTYKSYLDIIAKKANQKSKKTTRRRSSARAHIPGEIRARLNLVAWRSPDEPSRLRTCIGWVTEVEHTNVIYGDPIVSTHYGQLESIERAIVINFRPGMAPRRASFWTD